MHGEYSMSTTLTNGLKLPDKGSVDWYADMQNNYTILDGAVGTIAEHTSALSGKAPLVHTHVKADITDFPAYGTTAGTICEGNDSRLSDARTPVAHTHTKSDVTDLLNSDFIPSANNSYNLGSSSYQWNNLYAKNYYYNGTEFQNKFVTLDSGQTIKYSKTFAQGANLDVHGYRFRVINDDMELGVVPTSNQWTGMLFTDKNKTNISEIVQSFQRDGRTLYQINVFPNEVNSQKRSIITYTYNSANNISNAALSSNIIPVNSNTYDLGSSTNKWKTLNGINPGALSLPRGYTEEGADKHYINIASVIQTLDGTIYNYTMPDNGWICVRAEQAQQVHVTLSTWYFGQSVSHPTGSTLIVSVPFRKNDQISLRVKAVSLQYARFYPMQGNV